jgi:hypothetical protein
MPYARVAGALRRWTLQFLLLVAFSECEDLEIIFANASCLRLEYYGYKPKSNNRKFDALARVLLPHYEKVANRNKLEN